MREVPSAHNSHGCFALIVESEDEVMGGEFEELGDEGHKLVGC